MDLVDSHCHLTHNRFQDDLAAVVLRAQEVGVNQMLCVGTGLEDAQAAAALRQQWPEQIALACGLDPFTCHQRYDSFDEDCAALESFLSSSNCCALGEVGLEYFHPLLPPEAQRHCLQRQIDLALQLDLPLILHVRDAHADMLAILREQPQARGVIHSFDGRPEEAAQYLELGWLLSFNGMLTFAAKDYLREALGVVPDTALLFETDSPFLAPHPQRGRRCEPSLLPLTINCAAETRKQDPLLLAAQSSTNARQLFALPGGPASQGQ